MPSSSDDNLADMLRNLADEEPIEPDRAGSSTAQLAPPDEPAADQPADATGADEAAQPDAADELEGLARQITGADKHPPDQPFDARAQVANADDTAHIAVEPADAPPEPTSEAPAESPADESPAADLPLNEAPPAGPEQPFVTPDDTATRMDHEATADLATDVDSAYQHPAQPDQSQGQPARRPGHRHRPAASGANFKAVVAPVLITVGLLVLAPAVWGLLVLMGVDVFSSGRDSANTMAKVMLICWPMGIALIVAGIVCLVQANKQKRRNL